MRATVTAGPAEGASSFTLLASVVIPLVLAAPSSAEVVVSTWAGGARGVWSEAGSWDPRVVPQNGGGVGYSVLIDGSRSDVVVTADLTATIDALAISAVDELQLQTGKTLTIVGGGVLPIDGLLTIGTGGTTLTQLVLSQDTTITGLGTVALGSAANYRLVGAPGKRITVAPEARVTGVGGAFGHGIGLITNHGLIESLGGTAFTVKPAIGLSVNDGVIRATEGTLNLTVSTLDNTDGVIGALPNGLLQLGQGGGTVTGGTLGGLGGIVRFVGGKTTLDQVDVQGPIEIVAPGGLGFDGTLVVHGSILMDGTPSSLGAKLSGSPSACVLTGDADITMISVSPGNASFSGNGPMTIDRGIAISGGGHFGTSLLTLLGSVTGTSTGIRILSTQFVNQGSLTTLSGPLEIHGATVLNGNNTITFAGPLEFKQLENAILGGVLQAVGEGRVQIPGATTTDPNLGRLANLQLLSDVDVNQVGASGGAVLQLDGTITLDGTMSLNAGPGSAELRVGTADVFLNALPGEEARVILSNSTKARVSGATTGNRLHIGEGIEVTGAGSFGQNGAGVPTLLYTNHHRIVGTGGTMVVRAALGVSVNDGEMRAENGTLFLTGNTTLDNAGGEIVAGPEGVVQFGNDVIIKGGVLHNDGGTLNIAYQGTTYLSDLLIEGASQNVGSAGPVFSGTITNHGTMSIGSAAIPSGFGVKGATTTFNGPGAIVFAGPGQASIKAQSGTVNGLLVNGPDHVLRGPMKLGLDTLSVLNEGSIIAEGGAVTIDPLAAGSFTNLGLLHALSGDIAISPGGFSTSGDVVIEAGRVLERQGNYVQSDGVTLVRGQLKSIAGGNIIAGGRIRGTGSIAGTLVVNGGRVEPGDPAGTGLGTLSTAGYTQNAGGSLVIEVGGDGEGAFDRVTAVGTASLGGTLEVSLEDGYVPAPGTTLTILNATTRVGTFASVHSCVPLTVVYLANQVRITFGDVGAIQGDLDGSGAVDGADLTRLLGAWGLCADPCCLGDLDGDAEVGAKDLCVLLGNWTEG